MIAVEKEESKNMNNGDIIYLDYAANTPVDNEVTNILDDMELIYTSGSSESNNLAIKGIARTYREKGKHIITTFLEHSSVSSPLTSLKEQGYEIDLLELNSDGKVNIDNLNEENPFILNLGVKGIKAEDFKQKLEGYRVCISIKSACSVVMNPSRAVMAITHDRKRALSSWRISLSHLTTWKEINKFLEIFDKCYNDMCK